MEEKDENKVQNETKEIVNILVEYFEVIRSCIENSEYMNDFIMQEKCEYEDKSYPLIRHDLDIKEYIDFDKIFETIKNDNNYKLNSFEKRAKASMMTIARNLIKVYGLEELEENSFQVFKELKYGTFFERFADKENNYCETINKIGDTYGVESIEKIKDLNLLEARLRSLLNICKDSNEYEKIESIISKVMMIKSSLPIDVQINLQIDFTKRNIRDEGFYMEKFYVEEICDFEKIKQHIIDKKNSFIIKNKSYLEKNPMRKNGPFELDINILTTALEMIDDSQEKCKKILNRKDDFVEIITADQMENELNYVYESYNQTNREMLLNRLGDKIFNANEDNPNQLMLVHFFTDFDNKNDSDGINLSRRIKRTLKKKIENETGKRFSPKCDRELLEKYYKEARNPLSIKKRVPTKIQYMNSSHEWVLTKPTSLISMTITKKDKLEHHLGRKIGFGCLGKNIGPDAIYTISSGYNLSNDENVFSEHQVPISELNGVQETMVDWNKITIDYIIYVKTEEKMEESEEYKKACKLSEENNLPLVVYDEYSLNMKRQNKDRGDLEIDI